jgi:hypothetical protein
MAVLTCSVSGVGSSHGKLEHRLQQGHRTWPEDMATSLRALRQSWILHGNQPYSFSHVSYDQAVAPC